MMSLERAYEVLKLYREVGVQNQAELEIAFDVIMTFVKEQLDKGIK